MRLPYIYILICIIKSNSNKPGVQILNYRRIRVIPLHLVDWDKHDLDVPQDVIPTQHCLECWVPRDHSVEGEFQERTAVPITFDARQVADVILKPTQGVQFFLRRMRDL
jgi:hypothetical protein